MRIELTKKDVIWSYIGTIFSMTSNLLLLPFIIFFLNDDLLGLWYVFSSLGAIATLFDCGFSVTFARNITYCWGGADSLKREGVNFSEHAEPDFRLMKRVLTTCRKIYAIISASALGLLLTAGTAYVMYVSKEIPGHVHLLAWTIYAVAIFLNLYYGYFAAFLRGIGAVGIANRNTVFARCAQIILTILLLVFGCGLIGVCVGYLAYGTLFRVLSKRRFFQYKGIGKKLAQVREQPGKSEMKELFLVVWHNAWRDGVISISNYLCNQASTLVCSLYFSLAETGIYSLGVQIATAISAISATLYTAYQPTLQEAYVNRNHTRMQQYMALIVVSFLCLFTLGTAGMSLVGLPLLRLIKPDTVVSVSVLLGLCFYQFTLQFRNCYTSYFSCTNRIIYMKAFLLSSITSIALSFLMVGTLRMGIWGLIVAQVTSQLMYNAWAWPLKAHRELKMSFPRLLSVGANELIATIKRFLSRKERPA